MLENQHKMYTDGLIYVHFDTLTSMPDPVGSTTAQTLYSHLDSNHVECSIVNLSFNIQ